LIVGCFQILLEHGHGETTFKNFVAEDLLLATIECQKRQVWLWIFEVFLLNTILLVVSLAVSCARDEHLSGRDECGRVNHVEQACDLSKRNIGYISRFRPPVHLVQFSQMPSVNCTTICTPIYLVVSPCLYVLIILIINILGYNIVVLNHLKQLSKGRVILAILFIKI